MGQRFGTAIHRRSSFISTISPTAVMLAVEQRLDGVYNVAPDGWIAGERVRALAGAVPRLKLPDRLSEVIANQRWRFQRGPIPPGLRSYTRSPWLVANDRLKAAGWQPNVTNEQAYVEGTEGKWWTMVSPKRRQEVTLGRWPSVACADASVRVVSRCAVVRDSGAPIWPATPIASEVSRRARRGRSSIDVLGRSHSMTTNSSPAHWADVGRGRVSVTTASSRAATIASPTPARPPRRAARCRWTSIVAPRPRRSSASPSTHVRGG